MKREYRIVTPLIVDHEYPFQAMIIHVSDNDRGHMGNWAKYLYTMRKIMPEMESWAIANDGKKVSQNSFGFKDEKVLSLFLLRWS